MAILSGRLTCTRFRGIPQRQFLPEHLLQLEHHSIARQRIATADGGQFGWIAGDHVLDLQFDLAKNIVNDALHFALRIDETKVPSELLPAYTKVELDALAKDNPSGIPSARQKREARRAARERLEEEARDGRWLRRKLIPVLWDAQTGQVIAGTTSPGAIERVCVLFQKTFDVRLEGTGAGLRGARAGDAGEIGACAFVAAETEVAWCLGEGCPDYLGNEFLLWLWCYLENRSDTLQLGDGSELTAMLTRVLALECPRGQTGKDSMNSTGPAKLPESLRAIQTGKLPRKAGLLLVRHDQQYELTLHAESLAIGSAKLPPIEAESERAALEERVTQVRHLLETIDLLFGEFLQLRLGQSWPDELAEVQEWLLRKERAV